MANEALQRFKLEVEQAADYEFELVVFTSWLRMAETRIGTELRCEDQIEFADALLTSGRVPLPLNWSELDMVRVVNGPILNVASLEVVLGEDEAVRKNRYAISGNYILVGTPISTVDGLEVNISYFKTIPPLGDAETWFSAKYRWILMAAVMGYAALHLGENDRAAMMAAEVSSSVAAVNEAYRLKKYSGSQTIAVRRNRGFS